MKRILASVLLLCLLTALTACGGEETSVRFYFQRSEIAFGESDGVIVPEERDTLSREDSLSYLLSLYLEGPIDPDLILPVPADTRIEIITMNGDHLILVMNDAFFTLEDMDLTLACACIGSTCFDLTTAQQITFLNAPAGNEEPISLTLTRDSLVLTDTVTGITEETPAKE